MTSNDEIARLLASIDRRLALLTASEERELQKALKTDLLSTPARLTMFNAIDGQRGGGEIGRLAGVSDRTGQLFVKELLDLGLVHDVSGETGGRGVVVERDEAAIVQWYLERRAAN